jgi:hypothetical protein
MTIISSRAGRIVVEHQDGYVFTFQVHDIDSRMMDLVDAHWAGGLGPPDADDLELQARQIAEAEAIAQGWL